MKRWRIQPDCITGDFHSIMLLSGIYEGFSVGKSALMHWDRTMEINKNLRAPKTWRRAKSDGKPGNPPRSASTAPALKSCFAVREKTEDEKLHCR